MNPEKNTSYTPTIGIEIHVQLATQSKMFCACDNNSVGAEPNTNVCPICLAYPGTLPLPNKHAVELAIRLGLGLNANIRHDTKFDRKNYFYPDSPKGYQITQFDKPIVEQGSVEILVDGEFKRIGIERAHMEEDAGKLTHPAGADYSLVDLNRAGTPLVEIVSMPDMHTPVEAKRYLQEIYAIATTLGVTHGELQNGNFKFDLNISVSKDDSLGTRTELKNLNSFRNAERALTYEIARQIEVLEGGGVIDQETRGWDDGKGKTFSQRSKEEAHDYRYFPEPDIPPLVVTDAMKAEQAAVVARQPLPIAIRHELAELDLTVDEQDMLISDPDALALFSEGRVGMSDAAVRKLISWLIGDYRAMTHSKDEDEVTRQSLRFNGGQLRDLVERELSGELSSKMAKQVFAELFQSGSDPATIIDQLGLKQISDTGELETMITEIVSANPQAVADFKSGNEKALGFFVGQVMARTKGQANPQVVNDIVRASLGSLD